MASDSVARIKENHVYLVGIEFPTTSPLTPLRHKMECHTLGNSKDMFIPQLYHGLVLSTALVLSYESRQSTAVILVGIAHPGVPHRYVPWEGTARLPCQPCECLKLTGARFVKMGYLNYTHCVRVRVMESEKQKLIFHDPIPQSIPLRLLEEEVSKLRNLHSAYWGGVRYSRDGAPMGCDRLGKENAELSDEEEDEMSEVECSKLQRGRVNMKHLIYRHKIKQVFLREEERAVQVELMRGVQVEAVDDLLKCHFFPFNRQMISGLA